MPTAGSPGTWTVRFKLRKSTTVLHLDPLQSFTSIKQDLLLALRETYPAGQLYEDVQIPSDAAYIVLGRPRDANDVTQGWKRVQDAAGIEGDDDDLSPKMVGLKDNAVLAYKFRTVDDGDDDDEGLGLEDEEWDVVIPSYEDITGTQNEGDVGAMPNYKG